MTGLRPLNPWGLALWALWLVAASGAEPGHRVQDAAPSAPPADDVLFARPAGAALLPGRTHDEVRVAVRDASPRGLGLAAALAAAPSLLAMAGGTAPAARPGHGALRVRRHAIALRAPPLQLA